MAKLKYGQINKTFPTTCFVNRIPTKASQTFTALGGRFVTIDASGYANLTAAADSQLHGWTEDSFTSSAVDAADSVAVIRDLNAIFEMPANAAFTAATLLPLIGKTCDIAVSGSGTTAVQKCNAAASTTDVLVIVGGDVNEQTFYVMINPMKYYTAGVV